MPKGKGKQPEETKKASEQDSDVTEVLELSYRELKRTIFTVYEGL